MCVSRVRGEAPEENSPVVYGVYVRACVCTTKGFTILAYTVGVGLMSRVMRGSSIKALEDFCCLTGSLHWKREEAAVGRTAAPSVTSTSLSVGRNKGRQASTAFPLASLCYDHLSGGFVQSEFGGLPLQLNWSGNVQ